MRPVMWIVSPCYNSTDVLTNTVPRFMNKLEKLISSGDISDKSRLLLVDDGSKDATWQMICDFRRQYDNKIAAVKLAHNSGEQNAYAAGMFTAVEFADVIVTMDCDLQDDIEKIDEMLSCYDDGCDIVYGVRNNRDTDKPLYRFLSGGFYKIMKLCGTETVEQNSQYRLMSRRAVMMLKEYGEGSIFLPALVPLVGLKSANVSYARLERPAGDSGYSYNRLFKLAFSAIISFSSVPLKLISIAAVGACILAVLFIVLFFVKGAADLEFITVSSVWFAAFFVLCALRLLGTYLYAGFSEAKKRPRYQIDIKLTDE